MLDSTRTMTVSELGSDLTNLFTRCQAHAEEGCLTFEEIWVYAGPCLTNACQSFTNVESSEDDEVRSKSEH